MTATLREPQDQDRELVRRWRNHPQVRRASFTSHEIPAAEHNVWWDIALADPNRHLLIFEWAGEPAGVVTFVEAESEAVASWGFYLDIEGLQRRDALVPAWIAAERAAIDYAFDTAGYALLRGDVLAWNRPVLQLHQRFGFTITGSYHCEIDGRQQEVLRTELAAADRAPRSAQPAAALPRPTASDEGRTTVTVRETHIAGTAIGTTKAPFVIAEMSGNHNGSLDRALKIVDAVARSGAHALKLQTYRPDTITIDVDGPAFRISDGHELWGGTNLYQLYQRAHTPWEWHEAIFDRAAEQGLTVFSSPFDPTAIDLLEKLNAPAYKIASSELVDLPLIRLAASTGKPLIMSTGMATVGEIDDAVRAARAAGCAYPILLSCTAAYPAPVEAANLRRIPVLADTFDTVVGLSDHTPGIGVPVAAVALGAAVIEKHVTLERDDGGVDSAFSLEPAELAALVVESRRAHAALGRARIGADSSEEEGLRFRRSLYVVADVRAGDRVTADNVRSIRPAGGLPPDEIATVLGRTFQRDAAKGTPLGWDLM